MRRSCRLGRLLGRLLGSAGGGSEGQGEQWRAGRRSSHRQEEHAAVRSDQVWEATRWSAGRGIEVAHSASARLMFGEVRRLTIQAMP